MTNSPPFRADHVGSLIRPTELIEARKAHQEGKLDAVALRAVQERAVREVVKMQEDIGLKSITDGEYNRHSWQSDFLLRFENVVSAPSKFAMSFHNESGSTEGRPHMVQVVGKLARPKPIFVKDYRFLQSVTKQTAKITLPSPSVMHFRGGRDAISVEAYPDMKKFYADLARVYAEEISDLADVGCRYLQLDEVNFAYLCDAELRNSIRTSLGENPNDLPHVYAKLINDALASKPDEMHVCMHLCRGNFAGNWVAQGGYEPVAEILFNDIDVDGYFLEYDTERAGNFEPLRFVPKNKRVVLGLITTKKKALETKDEIKRRIDEAARYVPLEQLALSPQCGFSSGIGGNTMTIEEEMAKLRLVVEVATEVWGEA